MDDLGMFSAEQPGRRTQNDPVLFRRLALFGSRLKGTARADSDLDLLVDFEPDGIPGLLGLAAMEAELSDLLGGRDVDLRTPQDLSRYFRDEGMHAATVQYER